MITSTFGELDMNSGQNGFIIHSLFLSEFLVPAIHVILIFKKCVNFFPVDSRWKFQAVGDYSCQRLLKLSRAPTQKNLWAQRLIVWYHLCFKKAKSVSWWQEITVSLFRFVLYKIFLIFMKSLSNFDHRYGISSFCYKFYLMIQGRKWLS